MKVHRIKIKKDYLDNIIAGKKRAEIRLNDRDYQVGDECLLYEYESLTLGKIQEHNQPRACYTISHIHSGLGMADNYIVLSFKKAQVL